MKTIPPIYKYMTAMPHTIGRTIPVTKALDMMTEHNIRHLPVLDGGRLLGVLTDRDVKLARSFDNVGELKVEDVMIPDPYSVSPEAALDEVVLEMAEHKYGCCVVEQGNGKVVGIFTANDGLRVLGEILQKNYSPKHL